MLVGCLDRKGVIANDNVKETHQADERFILAANRTIPSEMLWKSLKTDLDAVHQFRK